jgi:hypothetical protein
LILLGGHSLLKGVYTRIRAGQLLITLFDLLSQCIFSLRSFIGGDRLTLSQTSIFLFKLSDTSLLATGAIALF